MQPDKDVYCLLSPAAPELANSAQPSPRLIVLAAFLVLTLLSLACAVTGAGSRSTSRQVVILTRLPTLTRTPLPTLTPTGKAPPVAVAEEAEGHSPPSVPQAASESPIIPTQSGAANVPPSPPDPSSQNAAAAPAEPVPANSGDSPVNPPPAIAIATLLPDSTPTATAIPAPTDTPMPTETPVPTDTPTPTVTPTPQAWAFSGVRLSPNPYNDGLLLYGNLVNNSSTAQKLMSVLGTFYDTQNQVIAGPDNGESYWPAYVVAPGASMPFELDIETIDNAANFDLNVAAEPSDEIPRQDFEFLGIDQWADEESYCVGGELKNHGGELHDYLVIALTLFDSQENIVSFSYYEELDPNWIGDGDELDFELCSDLLGQAVAHHTLQAWGR